MKTIRAVYEGGVFKPQDDLTLPAGTMVHLILAEQTDDPVEIMKQRYPISFGCMADEDAEEMTSLIEDAFERVDPDDWK
jgi:predicted DNA-binding antitoxin AbrB/MazE fold protein